MTTRRDSSCTKFGVTVSLWCGATPSWCSMLLFRLPFYSKGCLYYDFNDNLASTFVERHASTKFSSSHVWRPCRPTHLQLYSCRDSCEKFSTIELLLFIATILLMVETFAYLLVVFWNRARSRDRRRGTRGASSSRMIPTTDDGFISRYQVV